ncbi:hypothetical protein [Aquimarina sediminis]|uniref:hypothetical protein n=1 Tax=Aquimarina sediminis TaxID=2070536 RepID=UPI000CA082D3|nr:hypothetical protein [Aquimarina sediminis]
MEVTKFHQLCAAYNKAQNNFEEYKKSCHVFSVEIVKELKAYYNIPESQFSLFKINKEKGFELVPSALIHAISLEQDFFWHFGIGLTVCKAPETLPEELILIHLMFRKSEKGSYLVKYAHSKEEFEVKKGDSSSYKVFFDFLFEIIVSSYNEQLQLFVGEKTTRKLGFRK